MTNKNVRLKNRNGDNLLPYTDNIPAASTSVAGKVKLDTSPASNSNNAITSGAVYTALNDIQTNLSTLSSKADKATSLSGYGIADAYTKTEVDNKVKVLTPVGAVIPYAYTKAPSGWLLCSGQAVSRTTYSALFAVIGTTYGAGDGSTTFNLPNLSTQTDNIPNYAALVTITATTYTAPSNGIIHITATPGNATTALWVDNKLVCYIHGHSGSSHGQPNSGLMAILKKGNVVKITSSETDSTKAKTYKLGTFIPFTSSTTKSIIKY